MSEAMKAWFALPASERTKHGNRMAVWCAGYEAGVLAQVEKLQPPVTSTALKGQK